MPGSEEYAALYTYIQDYSERIGIEKRPIIVICPGGAYDHTSDREAEPLALSFNAMGYHAAVLRYSTGPSEFPIALSELAEAVRLIRKNADKWHIDKDRIIVQGSSAGGHLAACIGTFWNMDFLSEILAKNEGLGEESKKEIKESIRPNGLILNYPVISAETFAHAGSARSITGELENADAFTEEKGIPIKEFLSLEKRITEDMPPCFIWHTFEDQAVPVENSLMLATALKKAGINTELHIYAHGCHGTGLGNGLTAANEGKEVIPEVQSWPNLCRVWLERNYPITYKYSICDTDSCSDK